MTRKQLIMIGYGITMFQGIMMILYAKIGNIPLALLFAALGGHSQTTLQKILRLP